MSPSGVALLPIKFKERRTSVSINLFLNGPKWPATFPTQGWDVAAQGSSAFTSLGFSKADFTWRKWMWNWILADWMIHSSKRYGSDWVHNATHTHMCLLLFNACGNHISAWPKFPLFAKVKMLLLLTIKLFSPFIHSYRSWSAPMIFKDVIEDLWANSA